MRSDLSLDSNSWDLVITDDIGIVENAAMTSQDSKFSLQLIQGEVFDDNRIGMPWLTDMVSPQVSIAAKKQIIRDVIMSTPGAIEITRLEVAVNTDSAIATCKFEGITDNGDIFGTSITSIPTHEPEPSGIIAEYDYTTGRSFGLRLERASNGTYIDSGVLKTAGVNIPRFEYDGLLTEMSSSNITFPSEGWAASFNASGSWAHSSPDSEGFITVTGASNPGALEGSYRDFAANAALQNNTATLSIDVKKIAGYRFIIRAYATGSSGGDGFGTITGEFIDGRPLPSSSVWDIRDMGSWLRIKLRRSFADGTSIFRLYPFGSNIGASGALTYRRVQVEYNPVASSYIKTTTATVSRAADSLTLIQTGAKWLYREYIPLGSSAVTKELVAYTGEVCPYGHLQKLRVWNRDLTSNEREVLGV